MIDAPCPSCRGHNGGCAECDNSGRWHIRQCPQREVSACVGKLCEYADLIEAGAGLPEAGGVNDQPATFLEGLRLLKRAEGAASAGRERREDP